MPSCRCQTCNKSFSRKADLKRHERLHGGIRPYKCETCGKAFSQSSGLKTHHNIHTGAKPFPCGKGDCSKRFSDPSSAARHRKEIHSGAYYCKYPGCRTSIKRRTAFSHHLEDIHGQEPDASYIDSCMGAVKAIKVRDSKSDPVHLEDTVKNEPLTEDILTMLEHPSLTTAWNMDPEESKDLLQQKIFSKIEFPSFNPSSCLLWGSSYPQAQAQAPTPLMWTSPLDPAFFAMNATNIDSLYSSFSYPSYNVHQFSNSAFGDNALLDFA